jgi:hypothetical protein
MTAITTEPTSNKIRKNKGTIVIPTLKKNLVGKFRFILVLFGQKTPKAAVVKHSSSTKAERDTTFL